MSEPIGDRDALAACMSIEGSQELDEIFDKLISVDIDSVSDGVRRKLLSLLAARVGSSGGPLAFLGMPQSIQAEMVLFSGRRVPGLDRTAYLRATPRQIIRSLILKSGCPRENEIHDKILANYSFARFNRDHWKEYFAKCADPLPFAKVFLLKDEKAGGFSDAEVTDLALRNHKLIDCIPPSRIGPDSAVALLISGHGDLLWKTYDFSRLKKDHWRELFLHTNPQELPAASKPFIENKDGNGFTSDELINMARSCHALINLLDPETVPFNVAYELYLTGRADILWKNYPFAQLDKSEWRKILCNPSVRIPDVFLEIAKGRRFKVEELCDLARKNDRLLPFLVAADIPVDSIIDLLLQVDATYIWENFKFSKLDVSQWERLILNLADLIRPRAMAAFNTCKGFSAEQITKIIHKNTAYCPYVEVSLIEPALVVEVLTAGKGRCLWDKYDFSRLSVAQWLDLLTRVEGDPPLVGQRFLQENAATIDRASLNRLLAWRGSLIKFVDASLIDTALAYSLILSDARHELWRRYDFTRFSVVQLKNIAKKTVREGDWPESLRKCFAELGKPFDFGDILEIAVSNTRLVIELLSFDIADKIDESQFEKIVSLASNTTAGVYSLGIRVRQGEKLWSELSRDKLMSLLMCAPDLRHYIEWEHWPFKDIVRLAKKHQVFEAEVPHPKRYFLWKRWKSLAAMVLLTVAAVGLIVRQGAELAERDVERQRWNRIVDQVTSHYRSEEYGDLAAFLKSISPEDLKIVGQDLMFRKAVDALRTVEEQNKANHERIIRLRNFKQNGWRTEDNSAVDELIKVMSSEGAAAGAFKDEFLALKDEYARHVKEVLYALARDRLKEKLSKVRNSVYDNEEDVVAALSQIAAAKAYPELEREHEECERMLVARKDSLAVMAFARAVNNISNKVESVAAALQREGASERIFDLKVELDAVSKESAFTNYFSTCARRYNEVQVSFTRFSELQGELSKCESEADDVVMRFKDAFLFVDDIATCSNLLTRCSTAANEAKSAGGFVDLIKAYSKVSGKVRGVLDRDLRCWKLIDRLNAVKKYPDYCVVRKELDKSYGSYKELSHLPVLGNVDEKDAQRLIQDPNSSSSSWFGGSRSCRFKFVGVIKLQPENPNKVSLCVDSEYIRKGALLYLLHYDESENNAGNVLTKRLMRYSLDGKFYLNSNFDYSRFYGAPLFVREDDYIGGR